MKFVTAFLSTGSWSAKIFPRLLRCLGLQRASGGRPLPLLLGVIGAYVLTGSVLRAQPFATNLTTCTYSSTIGTNGQGWMGQPPYCDIVVGWNNNLSVTSGTSITLYPNVRFTGSSSYSYVRYLQYSIDGGARVNIWWNPTGQWGGWEAELNEYRIWHLTIPTSAGGNHTVTFYAANGYTGSEAVTSVSYSVTVPNSAPTIAWSTQPPATIYSSSWFPLKATATDADGNLTGVWVEQSVNGGAWTALAYDSMGQPPFGNVPLGTYTTDSNIFAGPPSTTYQFRCYAGDQAGANSGWLYSSVFTVANRVPVVSSLTLTPSTIEFGQSTAVSATITDGDGNLYALGVLRYNGSTYFKVPGVNYNRTGWDSFGADGNYYSALSFSDDQASGASTTKNLNFTPPGAGSFTIHANGHDGINWASGAYSSVTVNKATPVGTFSDKSWPTTHTIVAADLDAAFANPYNGTVAAPTGSITYNYSVGTTLTPGDYFVTATYAGDGNYNGATKQARFTVNKLTPTITWNNPAAITYGTALSGTQLNATASVPGTFAYTPSSGTVLHSGPQTLSVTFTPTDTVTYSNASKSVSIQINKAGLTIKADDKTRPYNQPNPAFTAQYLGLVNGDTSAVITGLTIATTAVQTSPVGLYPITMANGSATDYTISYQNGTLTVTPASQIVLLTSGNTTVSGGSSGNISATTGSVVVFTASGGSSGVYTWTSDGVTQGTTGSSFSTSFSSGGAHVVTVKAEASGNYNASQVATLNVSVTATNIWTTVTGQSHAVALKADGTLWSWGGNASGQLGDGSTTSRTAPAQVTSLTGLIAIAAGGQHSLALKIDGSIWSWGNNSSGQLGDNSTNSRSVPAQITTISGVVDTAGGSAHTVALKSNGTVWAWGANASGQLGDGSTTQRLVPVQVTTVTGVTAIAAGSDHTVAIRSDGSVWAWGKNTSGQLGDGGTTNRTAPVQIASSGFIDAAAGGGHTLLLKSDGTVWACGANGFGQLGDETTTQRLAPTQIPGLTGVILIAAGSDHSLAVKSNGTVWCWGRNNLGQVGDSTTTNRSAPVQLSGMTNAVTISAAGDHSFATKNDGTIWSWGGDGFGSATIANQRINQAALRLISAVDDTDQDGMSDALETQYFGGLSRTGGTDNDSDGLVDVQELFLGADPTKTDTDGDGVSDLNDPYPSDYYNGQAPSITVLSGNNQTGHAGQFNGLPFDIAIATNPGAQLLVNAPVTLTVSSGGGLLATTNVGSPVTAATLSMRTASDGTVKSFYKQPAAGGITSQIKVTAGTATPLFLTTMSSTAADADGNGLLDSWELQYFGRTGINPNADSDGDGLSNVIEMNIGSDPTNPDSDNDGTNDGTEYNQGRDPTNPLDKVSLPTAYQMIIVTPGTLYYGIKPDWTITSVTAP